jgi:hypothetical protein
MDLSRKAVPLTSADVRLAVTFTSSAYGNAGVRARLVNGPLCSIVWN